MAEIPDAALKKSKQYRFKQRSTDEKDKILKDKDKKSTQRATDIYMKQFSQYLLVNNLPNVEDLQVDSGLDQVLADFYASVQPQKKEDYSVQTLKCIRSGLNRYFRQFKGIDIAKNPMFVKANEMLKAIQVDAKKKGLGVNTQHHRFHR